MRFLERYPYVAMFLAFFLSSCLFAYGTFPVRMGAVSFALVLLTLAVLRVPSRFPLYDPPHIRTAVLLMLSAILAAGLWSVGWNDFYAARIERMAGERDRVRLRITDCDYTYSYASRYRAEILESDLLPKRTGIFFETSSASLPNGTVLEGEVEYASLAKLSGGTFDAVRYYRADRIFLVAEGELRETGFRKVVGLRALFSSVNDRLSAVLVAHAGRDAGGLGAAVMLGNRTVVPDTLTRDFRRIGVSHLLVVSGTHFSVLISLIAALLRRTRIHRRRRAWITIACILLFMFLAGGTPSVVRAGVMHLLVQLAVIVARKADSLNSFAVSGAFLLLVNPFAAADCGLQLSFAATYACILFVSHRGALARQFRKRAGKDRRKRILLRLVRRPLELILMTAWVSVVTLPLIWLYFGEVPLLSVPANLIFVPLVTAYMYLTLLFLVLSPLAVFTPPLALLMRAGYGLVSALASSLSRFDRIVLPVNYDFAVFFLLPAALLFVSFPFLGGRAKRPAFLAGLSLTLVFFGTVGCVRLAARNDVVFTYLNAGKNDSFVLLAENRVLLGDMSDGSSGAVYRTTEEMAKMHAAEVDAVVLTHYHKKHSQLLGRLCERQIVRSIVLPEPENEDERLIYETLCELAGDERTTVITVPSGESFDFHGVAVTVYPRTMLSRSTHPVSGVSLRLPDCLAVLASSSFNQGADSLVDAVSSADVLLLGPHSPVYKKTFRLDGKPEVLALCEDALAYAEGLEGYAYIPIDGTPVRITGKKRG